MNAYLRAASLAALAVCAGGALLSSAIAQNDAVTGPPLATPGDILPHEAMEAAGAYAAYVRRAQAIPTHFDDSAQIVRALTDAESYEPNQLEQGMIAYGALVAAEDPRFAEGVRQAAADPATREQLVQALMADPTLAGRLPGSADAAQLVGQVLRTQAQGLAARGEAIRQTSFDIQLSAPWSKHMTPDPEQRLQNAKLISATRIAIAADDISRAMAEAQADQAPVTTGGEASGRPMPQAMARGLALAAIAIAGSPDEADAAARQLMDDRAGGQCLHMAKLNLYQCLAVAGPHYEDLFCLGRHAIAETAACVSDAAGPAPAPMAFAQAATTPTYDAPATYAQAANYSPSPSSYAQRSSEDTPAATAAWGGARYGYGGAR